MADASRRASIRNGNAGPVGERIAPGQRNREPASLAGSMRRRGMGKEEMFKAVVRGGVTARMFLVDTHLAVWLDGFQRGGWSRNDSREPKTLGSVNHLVSKVSFLLGR